MPKLFKLSVILFSLFWCFSLVGQDKVVESTVELSPNLRSSTIYQSPEAMWDLLFSFDVTAASGAAGNAGAEFDGTYFYTTRWASNLIHKYDMTGTLVEEFSIPGVSGLRDLAFDGTYFYGGAASTTIYQMDFVTKTLIGTIPVTASGFTGVRNIAYDSDNDGFWCGNWSDSETLFDRTGTVLDQIATGLTGQYGSAYDNVTPGGPYLWVYDQGLGSGTPQLVYQFDIASGLATGVSYDTALDFGAAAPIAGGLWSSADYSPGLMVLGGLAQGTPDYFFVYDITSGPTVITIAEAIEDLDNDFVPDHLGETVTVQGVVFSPNYQTTNNSFYISDIFKCDSRNAV